MLFQTLVLAFNDTYRLLSASRSAGRPVGMALFGSFGTLHSSVLSKANVGAAVCLNWLGTILPLMGLFMGASPHLLRYRGNIQRESSTHLACQPGS